MEMRAGRDFMQSKVGMIGEGSNNISILFELSSLKEFESHSLLMLSKEDKVQSLNPFCGLVVEVWSWSAKADENWVASGA